MSSARAILGAAAILAASLAYSANSLSPTLEVKIPEVLVVRHVLVTTAPQIIRIEGIPPLTPIIPSEVKVAVETSLPPIVLETP